MEVSFFKNVYAKTPESDISFDDFITAIRIGKWQDLTLNYRTGKIKKENIPCITPSGNFTERKSAGIKEHSGIINIDIDKGHNDVNLLDLREQLYADEYVFAGHVSVSGKGLSLYFKINSKKHRESFDCIEKYLANKYNVTVDTATKDLARLRIISYDPEAHYNTKSKKWDVFYPKEQIIPEKLGDYIGSENDFNFVMSQIKERSINIAEDYHDWIKLGFAIYAEFGESGFSYWDDISKMSSKYNHEATSKKWENLIKTNTVKSTLSTFFWYAKQAGCKIRSERTDRIFNTGKTRLRTVGKNGGASSVDDAKKQAKEYLRDIEGIEGDDVHQILSKLDDLKPNEIKEKTDLQQKLDICMQVIKQKKLRKNEITGNIDGCDGIVTDNLINSYYLDCLAFDDAIKKETFVTVLFSNRVPSYDPFQEYIKKNKHVKPKGCIDSLLNCIKDYMPFQDGIAGDYKEIFVRKWLLSIIASIHGTYSLMILVLTGKQMIEKTNWFRGLLPDELKMYYGESKLDAGKDDEILMTQKAIICDDEFGGKSKQEAKKLKDLSSKQYFSIRKPYAKIPEDIRRIAVLCGTSNDDEILNDPTGNRRIIPLKVLSIDKKMYDEIDKDELFMEMYHEWKANPMGWMLTKEEVDWLNQSTQKHEQDIIEKQLIEKHCILDDSRFSRLSSTDIKVELELKSNQKLSLYKVGQSLNQLGYKKTSQKLSNGAVQQIWNVRMVTDVDIV